MIKCQSCKDQVDELAVFPGGICLTCYSLTEEATATLTADDVRRMWGMK